MKFVRTIALFAAAAAVFAAPALGDNAKRFQLKIGAAGILPDESASITPIGGTARISNQWVPSLQAEYFFTDNLSAELLCCVARHDVAAVGTGLGTVNLGRVTHFPPTVTLKYRLTRLGNFEPYIGAGVNYTHFFNAKLPAGVD